MEKEIEKSLEVLKRGGLILYPTDTLWSIGCDATNAMAVAKIYQLKHHEDASAMICLVSDMKMLNQYVESVPEPAYDIIKYASKPTTIIYDNPIRVADNLVAEDNTLAIRVTPDAFCKNLIRKFRKPLVSASANLSGSTSPKEFKEIHPAILEGVDYVVNLHRAKKNTQPSAFIQLKNDGTVRVIRS